MMSFLEKPTRGATIVMSLIVAILTFGLFMLLYFVHSSFFGGEPNGYLWVGQAVTIATFVIALNKFDHAAVMQQIRAESKQHYNLMKEEA